MGEFHTYWSWTLLPNPKHSLGDTSAAYLLIPSSLFLLDSVSLHVYGFLWTSGITVYHGISLKFDETTIDTAFFWGKFPVSGHTYIRCQVDTYIRCQVAGRSNPTRLYKNHQQPTVHQSLRICWTFYRKPVDYMKHPGFSPFNFPPHVNPVNQSNWSKLIKHIPGIYAMFISVYIYICISVCIYVYIYIPVYLYVYTIIHIYIHIMYV